MRRQRLFEVSPGYLTLVVTYECSARCAHCCLGAGTEHDERM